MVSTYTTVDKLCGNIFGNALPVDYLLSAGVKVVIYSGQLDIICATQGVCVCMCLCVRAHACACLCVCVCLHSYVPLYVYMLCFTETYQEL